MFGKKKQPVVKEQVIQDTRPIWERLRDNQEARDKENEEQQAYEDAYNKKYNPKKYEYDHMTPEEKRQEFLKSLDVDPYQDIRDLNRQYYDENEPGCIITRDYIIDAWLCLAQQVYYEDERYPNKKLAKQVKEFNYLLHTDFKIRLNLANNFGSWYSDDLYTGGVNKRESFTKNESWEFFHGFKFNLLDKKDTNYLEYLNKYCEEHYHRPLNSYDATFKANTAALFVADFITNGLDYNFISFNVNATKLNEILLLRAKHIITKEEFLALDDNYGKPLLTKNAINSEIGIMVYPAPLYANINKLKIDIKNMALLELRTKYGLDGYEVSKDVEFDWQTYDNCSNGFEQKMIGKLYPLYYFNEEGKVKKLPMYAIDNHIDDARNNYKNGGKEFNPTKEIVSIKEANADIGNVKVTFTINNADRVQTAISRQIGKKKITAGQLCSPSDYDIEFGNSLWQGKKVSKEEIFYAKDLCQKYAVSLSVTDYIDDSSLFEDYINLFVLTKDYMSIPAEDLPENFYLNQQIEKNKLIHTKAVDDVQNEYMQSHGF